MARATREARAASTAGDGARGAPREGELGRRFRDVPRTSVLVLQICKDKQFCNRLQCPPPTTGGRTRHMDKLELTSIAEERPARPGDRVEEREPTAEWQRQS